MDSNKYVDEIQAAGHLLWLDDEGEVDMYAMSYEYHNGPMCELCSDAWCVHCQPTVDQCSAAAIDSTCESVGDAKVLLPMTPNAALSGGEAVLWIDGLGVAVPPEPTFT